MSVEGNGDEISGKDELSIDQSATSISISEASTSRSELETDKYGFIGGKEYTHSRSGELSVNKVRKREGKWMLMLEDWDKWISKRFPQLHSQVVLSCTTGNKVQAIQVMLAYAPEASSILRQDLEFNKLPYLKTIKRRCRKGIPSSLRGKAWQSLCGSKQLLAQHPDKYQKLLSAEASSQVVEDIEKDLHRQFPFHEMFSQRGGTGQQDLRNVLHAYSIHNSRDGYCQAQAPVAAVLLMHMPAEEAFWCMVALFDYYIPGYYSPGLEAVQVDGDVMQGLLRHLSSPIYKHLDKHHVSPMLYCTEWFLCIFSRALPWPCVLRLWDIFFCEGVKILFRCALIIVKSALGEPKLLKSLPGMYETLERIKKYDMKSWMPDPLIRRIMELQIEEQDLEREYRRLSKIRRKQNPQAKMVERKYRYTPTHNHRRVSVAPSTLKSKKKLNTVSANTPQLMAQAVEHEKRLNSIKSKKSSASIVLMEYRRNPEASPVYPPLMNGDVASSSSASPGTSFSAKPKLSNGNV